jgi:hypothetical protein
MYKNQRLYKTKGFVNIMQKVYSLSPSRNAPSVAKEPATHVAASSDARASLTSCESQTPIQPQQPELWFNPRTNRWISKSCRVYREILRDRALVEKGLQPGAKSKPKSKAKQKAKPQAQPQTPDEDSEDGACSARWQDALAWNTVQNYEQQYEPPTEQELAIARRDALFAKYRM